MKRTMLKSKIHRATVTEANVEYEGSVTIDRNLLEAADIVPYEQVDIYDCTNGNRLQTYVIEGEPGSGERGRRDVPLAPCTTYSARVSGSSCPPPPLPLSRMEATMVVEG